MIHAARLGGLLWRAGLPFAFGASGLPTIGVAQDFPNRAIRLVVPNPPGGTTDALGRVFAQALQERIGPPVVVDNRIGAGESALAA